MELMDKKGTRYVLSDGCLQVWRKNKVGYDSYGYPTCYPEQIVGGIFGDCTLRITVSGRDPIEITVKKDSEWMLQKFSETLKEKIDKSAKSSGASTAYRSEFYQDPNKIKCPQCGGENINIQMIQDGGNIKGKSEVREKSALTKVGNKAGRATMIAMTGGLWALTPKKSDFVEKNKTVASFQYKKMCICQQCGNSWEIK